MHIETIKPSANEKNLYPLFASMLFSANLSFAQDTLAGWTFPASSADSLVDVAISTHAAVIFPVSMAPSVSHPTTHLPSTTPQRELQAAPINVPELPAG